VAILRGALPGGVLGDSGALQAGGTAAIEGARVCGLECAGSLFLLLFCFVFSVCMCVYVHACCVVCVVLCCGFVFIIKYIFCECLFMFRSLV